jgi:hypothetical protein
MTSSRHQRPSKPISIQKEIFGPPPVLELEDQEAYETLLERLYADLKPADIIAESYLHDVAYWTWELRRWRRMRICLIEALMPSTSSWVLGAPKQFRLSYINETHDVDMQRIQNSTMPDALKKELAELVAELEKANLKPLRADHPRDLALLLDTSITRAFLEHLDYVERFDRQIVIAESRRNTCLRELERHRATSADRWREKIDHIDADFTMVKSKDDRTKKKAHDGSRQN